MDPGELRARRSAAQLLSEPGTGASEVVDRLLAVQAQDLRSARLAVRARTRGLTAADLDRELERGSLVTGWLCAARSTSSAARTTAWCSR